jgi:ribosomal protein S18 acetylase RimI-like enzyme
LEIKLQHIDIKSDKNAELLYELWQLSYAVEADWLEVDYKLFPPLQRTTEDFLSSKNSFFIYLNRGILVACLEIKELSDSLRVQSCLVHPDWIRKGIGKQLMSFVFDKYVDRRNFSVETGAKNKPAIALYKKVGFSIVGIYRTSGILKVKMIKKAP